jgi:hypothetical protein
MEVINSILRGEGLVNINYMQCFLLWKPLFVQQSLSHGLIIHMTSAGKGCQFRCSTDGNWQRESGAYVMHLVTSCQLQHIVHTVRQMETKETLRRLMQHVQTVSKTHFYNKILTSKNFSKPLGDPPPTLCAVYWSWGTLVYMCRRCGVRYLAGGFWLVSATWLQ